MRLFLILLGLSGFLFGQYHPFEMVPDSTIYTYVKDAKAVVLSDDRTVMVTENEIEYIVKRRIRINNKSGDKYDRVVLHESEFKTITNIEANIEDLFGNPINELEDDDIHEITISTGYMVTAKAFDGHSKTYPYIIEYTFTLEYESHLFWPDWKPQLDIPVLSSSYKLVFEDDVPYKTYKIGFNFEPHVYKESGDPIHLYAASNIPPLDYESYLPKEYKTQNAIFFEPVNFEFGESKGSFKSWNDVAKWLGSLYKDRFTLPETIVNEVKELIANESDPFKKIEILYKFLQDKTRYVQIYLDIGGLQPHSAEWVYNNRFGDCKDLATFMIALLKIADIESYPAIVRTKNSGHVYKEFPSQQFNHVITFIPLLKDTLWLDFTSYKDTPYNLEGTNALIVKEDKGEIIKIPQRSSKENLKQAFLKGKLNLTGSLQLSGNIKSKGSVKNYYIVDIAVLKNDELKRSLIKEFTRYQSNFSLENYGFQHDKSDASMLLVFSGEFKKFSRKVGKRLFINPNILNRETQNYVPDNEERTYPFDLVKYPYLDVDSLEIKLPKKYSIESAPAMKNIVHPFGKYITTYKIENGVFYYKRLFEYSVQLIYPEEFATFLEFYKTVVETDKSRFVLKEI